MFVASIAYLRTRTPKWDWLAVASAEIGVAFFTVVLVTGPIWAHPVWGIWWTWDARLTSTFVLWVLYVCYLLLRTLMDEPERRAVVSAVFGIFAAFDIPLVYFSIWFFRTQHPQPVIGDGGSLDPRMLRRAVALLGGMLGVLVLLLRQRYRLEALRVRSGAQLRMEAAAPENGSLRREHVAVAECREPVENRGQRMKNLNSCWRRTWRCGPSSSSINFTVSRRLARLQDEVRRLKETLKR